MTRKPIRIVAAGIPVGMIALIALDYAIPIYVYRLPGGGQRCTKCHDIHGSIRLDDLKPEGWIHLTGDVPQPAWLDIAQLFRNNEIDGNPAVRLLDLLAEHNCRDAKRIVLISADGAHVSIDTTDLTESARLVPRRNTARFADERIHKSAWLWAIVEICVVGHEPAIQIDGRQTSYGTMLAACRTSVPTETGKATFKDEQTNRKYRNVTSRLLTGIPIHSLIPPGCPVIEIQAEATTLHFNPTELTCAILARNHQQGQVMLVIPSENPADWPRPITAINCRTAQEPTHSNSENAAPEQLPQPKNPD